MTDTRETARKVRDQLCPSSVCVFDEGCGCMDAIAAAIRTARADALEQAAKVADKNGQFGTAAEIRALASEEVQG